MSERSNKKSRSLIEQIEEYSWKGQKSFRNLNCQTKEKLEVWKYNLKKIQYPKREVKNHIAKKILNLEDDINKIKQKFAAIQLSGIKTKAKLSNAIENIED